MPHVAPSLNVLITFILSVRMSKQYTTLVQSKLTIKIMKPISVLFIIGFCLQPHVDAVSSAIPRLLEKCYRRNYTTALLKPPLTIQLLVELTRKVESEEKDALNMRMFTTSLLHGLKFDGIQQTPGVTETPIVLPYRASGMQFHKYKLLVDYLTSGKPQLLPYDSVSTKELCLLHEIISNTVHVWERGNEGRTCPELRSMAYQRADATKSKASITKTFPISTCPAESGVVKTRWGTISPGHLIAAVASALQETTVPLKKIFTEIWEEQNSPNVKHADQAMGNINNVWVSTSVGDLAEATVRQASKAARPNLGNVGTWNSTYLPRIHYLKDEPFDMTRAELLGGIDGLIFADKIKEWLSVLSRTRFSQLLDMYYSSRGVAYDKSYRACERGSKLKKLLNAKDLSQQTVNVAKLLLEIGLGNQYVYEEALEDYAAKVVREFEMETEIAVATYNACEQNVDKVQPLEVLTILDETWTGHKAELLVGILAEAVDVNFYGSSLGILNGQSGRWLTNVTYSLVELYEDLHNVPKDSWQTLLRLSNALESVADYLQNQTSKNCKANKVPRSLVVIVMANTANLRKDDFTNSLKAIDTIKVLYPETRIFYITSSDNSKDYQVLANQYVNDIVIKMSEYSEAVVPEIIKELTRVPGRIMDFYCNSSQLRMEDYVTPDIRKFYEIHGEYIKRANFTVKFKGNDYGEASICGYNARTPENKICKGLVARDEVEFNPNQHCSGSYSCNVQFSVEVTKAEFKCSEFDCRYPDQMRLDILTSWTRKSGSSAVHCNVYTLGLILLSLTFRKC